MAKYRNSLPQLNGKLFLTDGGLETTLIFHDHIELPLFAAFDLLKTVEGEQHLKDYYRRYAKIAVRNKLGFMLEGATWRANRDWGDQLGYSEVALDAINQQAIEMMMALRDELETDDSPMVVGGSIGPRGDGYSADKKMSVEEARQYHTAQIRSFTDAGADMATALTLNYVEEAIGIVKAARDQGMPVVISFTVETDGRLPSGDTVQQAIEHVDAETDNYAAYFMINCAHPTHFDSVLHSGEPWLKRIRGIRANASCKSHAELDESEELDDGNPAELGKQYKQITRQLDNMVVIGGCCGTDHRHIEAMCESVLRQ